MKDTYIVVLLIALMGIYAFGFFGWPYMPKDIRVLKNLYYISGASAMYGLSIVIFMIAKSRKVKIVSCGWLGISSAVLYNELFLDPTNYTWWSAGLVVVVTLNLFLSVIIIEKLKQKKNDSRNS